MAFASALRADPTCAEISGGDESSPDPNNHNVFNSSGHFEEPDGPISLANGGSNGD